MLNNNWLGSAIKKIQCFFNNKLSSHTNLCLPVNQTSDPLFVLWLKQTQLINRSLILFQFTNHRHWTCTAILRREKASQHNENYNLHILPSQSLLENSLQQRGDANLVLFLQQWESCNKISNATEVTKKMLGMHAFKLQSYAIKRH